MGRSKVYYLMFFFYWKSKNVTQAAKRIYTVYGEGTITESIVQKRFTRLNAGVLNLDDQQRLNRLSTIDEDQIKLLIENNPRYTTRELAEMLQILKTTIHEYFGKLGYVNRFEVWVLYN